MVKVTTDSWMSYTPNTPSALLNRSRRITISFDSHHDTCPTSCITCQQTKCRNKMAPTSVCKQQRILTCNFKPRLDKTYRVPRSLGIHQNLTLRTYLSFFGFREINKLSQLPFAAVLLLKLQKLQLGASLSISTDATSGKGI